MRAHLNIAEDLLEDAGGALCAEQITAAAGTARRRVAQDGLDQLCDVM